MSKFTECSAYLKACLFVHIASIILHVISFLAPYWMVDPELAPNGVNTGLWLNCVDHTCGAIDFTNGEGWIFGASVVETIGMVLGLMALAIVLYHVFWPTLKQIESKFIWRKVRSIIGIVCSFLAALFCQIAIVVFIQNYKGVSAGNSLSWSVGVNIMVVVCFATSGLLQLVEILRVIFQQI